MNALITNRAPRRPVLAIALSLSGLLAVLLLLNLETLSWPFGTIDSPTILAQAIAYSPLEYFFSPDAYQFLSINNFTPWVTLSWHLDFSLFQLDPRAYRIHQFLVLAALLLIAYRILYGHTRSVLHTSVFCLAIIAAPATIGTAGELVSRHYLEGIVFSLMSFHCADSYRRGSRRAAFLLSVIFYGLALTAKEVYLPLPGILFFLFPGTFRRRIVLILPYAVVLLAYLAWRVHMLEGPGGYTTTGVLLGLLETPSALLDLPLVVLESLFGNLPTSVLLLTFFVFLLALNLRQLSTDMRLAIVVGAIGILLPILALQPQLASGIAIPRWMFVPSIALLLLMGHLCCATTSKSPQRLVLAVLSLISVKAIYQHIEDPTRLVYRSPSKLYNAILASDPNHYLRTTQSSQMAVQGLTAWVYVAKLYNGRWGTPPIFDPGQLLYHDMERRTAIPIGRKLRGDKSTFTIKSSNRDLIESVSFKIDSGMLTFSFNGIPAGQDCFIYFFGEHNGLLFRESDCRHWSVALRELRYLVRMTGYALADTFVAIWTAAPDDRLYSKRYKLSELVGPNLL